MAELPLTLAQIRQRVLRLLEDLEWVDSAIDSIASTPASGQISFNVNDPAAWANNSRWEIDQEIFLVTTGTANPITAQRAQEGTIAASHSSNTLARRNPRHLTATINEAINVVLHDWCPAHFPQLVWDTTTGGSFSSTKWIVTAPADAYTVERVGIQFPGGYTRLQWVDHTALEAMPTTFASTGLGFRLLTWDFIPGYTIYVLYGKRWPFLVADTDTVTTDFPDDGVDLLVTGAALYLAGWRQVPKGRPEEVAFAREAGTSSQVNFSAQVLQLMSSEWNERAKQVSARRPNRQPRSVWVGK